MNITRKTSVMSAHPWFPGSTNTPFGENGTGKLPARLPGLRNAHPAIVIFPISCFLTQAAAARLSQGCGRVYGGRKVELYLPTTNGEWLAWASALTTIFFGLLCMFAPRLSYRILRLQTHPNHPEALSESRATMAGFYLGVGLCCILLAQPMLWIALGVSWGFTAFGRLISMLSDNGNTLFNWISVIFEAALAAMPLAYALGLIA
jgi:Domain of unknown function (DUF4345)